MECVVQGIIETQHVEALEILLQGLCGVRRERLRVHEICLKSGPNIGAVPSEVRLICNLELAEPTWTVRFIGGAMRGAGAEQVSVLVRTVIESKASNNVLRLFYALGYKLDHELLRVGFSFNFQRDTQMTVTVSSINKMLQLHNTDEAVPVTPGIQLVQVTAPASAETYTEVASAVSSFCEYLAPEFHPPLKALFSKLSSQSSDDWSHWTTQLLIADAHLLTAGTLLLTEAADMSSQGGTSSVNEGSSGSCLPPRPTKRKGSEVWNHMEKITKRVGDKDVIEAATCNYCKKRLAASSDGNGTSTIMRHLQKHCPRAPLEAKQVGKGQQLLTLDTEGAPKPYSYKKEVCDHECVRMILEDELPFSHVEGKGFRRFCQSLNPKWKPMNRKSVTSGVWDLFQVEKAKIMSMIVDNNLRVSITTDTWTSIQNINYMVLTAHFVDNDWNLHKRILNFTQITSHKGDDIGRVVEECLNSWRIKNIFTITVDNASANDTAVGYMIKRMKSLNTLLLDGDYLHVRCCCHVLNLIVQDGLSELNKEVVSIRNAIKYIKSSPTRLENFRKFAVLEGFDKSANVGMDVCTRWNSTYKMLEGGLKFSKVFDRMAEEHKPYSDWFLEKDKNGVYLRKEPPLADDWESAKAFVHFLKKFYDATLRLSAFKNPTTHIVFEEIVTLQVAIEKSMNDHSNPALRRVAASMLFKFDKYWGSFEKVNPLFVIGNVLDPRWKLGYQKVLFGKIGVPKDAIDDITTMVKQILMRFYEAYKGFEPAAPQNNASEVQELNLGHSNEDDDTRAAMRAAYLQQQQAEQIIQINNEVDAYLCDPCEGSINPSFSVLMWWKVNASKYPIFAKVARDVLAMPCSTVASENAFSLGERTVNPFRSSLTPKMVEALVCTNDWIKAEEFNFYKEPTKEEEEFYKECEETENEIPVVEPRGGVSSSNSIGTSSTAGSSQA